MNIVINSVIAILGGLALTFWFKEMWSGLMLFVSIIIFLLAFKENVSRWAKNIGREKGEKGQEKKKGKEKTNQTTEQWTPPPIGDPYKMRLMFALITCGSSSLLITSLINLWLKLTFSWTIIMLVGLSFLAIGATWKVFTFEVPAWTGINIFNHFTGKQTTFLQGLHFKYPWEIIRPESTHSLKSIKESVKGSFPTGGGGPNEGSTVLLANFMFQFRPDPFNLITFEGVDNEVIKSGLVDQASSLLLEYIATSGKTAKKIRDDIKLLQEAIRVKFGVNENEARSSNDLKILKQIHRDSTPIELSYGIILVVSSLNDLDFEPEYQKVLTSRKAMDEIQAIANSIHEKAQGDMTRKEAWDEAMIVSGKSTGNIVKTTGGGQAIPFVNIGR